MVVGMRNYDPSYSSRRRLCPLWGHHGLRELQPILGLVRFGRFLLKRVSSPNSYLVLALNTFSLLAWRSGFLVEEAFSGGDHIESAILGQARSLVDHLPA